MRAGSSGCATTSHPTGPQSARRAELAAGRTLRTGLEAVRSHRLRSALTMLGILIGIAAVILTVGLGQGAQVEVRDRIAALGSNLLIVSPGSSTSTSGIRGGFGSASTLTTATPTALSVRSSRPTSPRSRPVDGLTVADRGRHETGPPPSPHDTGLARPY